MRVRADDVDAVQMQVYYEALAPWSTLRVVAAAERWMQTGRFFPTTGEWVTTCRDLAEAIPPVPWTPTITVQCVVCDDTGFLPADCVEGARCGRPACAGRSVEWAHPYVVRCACGRTN